MAKANTINLIDELSGLSWVEFTPGDIEKGEGGKPTRGYIEGIASAENVDEDGEIIVQDGMTISKGTPVTLEHPAGVVNIIGEVVEVSRSTVNGHAATLVKAAIMLTDKLGKLIWDKSVALKKAAMTMRLGFSIEGSAAKRCADNPRRILKAIVGSLAVTWSPRNKLALFSPTIAKGGIDGIQVAGFSKGSVGTVQQGGAFESVAGSELAPLVLQSHEAAPQPRKPAPTSDRLTATLKALGLSMSDLAVASLAKRNPGTPWAHVSAAYQSQLGGKQ